MASSLGPRVNVSHRGLVLQGKKAFEEKRSCPAQVGLQSVQTQSQVEVRTLLAELLLLEAMSECVLAYCAQARLLQTESMGMVCRGVWMRDAFLVPWHIA